MIEVDVSNWSSYFVVMKLLRFGFHKILFFFADGEKGPCLNLKKKCIRNGLSNRTASPLSRLSLLSELSCKNVPG